MKTIQTLILLAALASSSSILTARQATNAAGAASATVATNAVAAGQPDTATNLPPAALPEPGQPKVAALPASPGAAQQIPQPPAPEPAAPDKSVTAADAQPSVSVTASNQVAETVVPSIPAGGYGTNGLRMNFREAQLDKVLKYMSEAAGFVVVLDVRPKGTVTIMSDTPVTREEAVNLLDGELKKNGYGAVRNGRTLTIVPRDEMKIQSIPVYIGGDPASIPRTDQVVTQIIPVRFVEVGQLVKDLTPLVSTQTTMTANESGNEIVITDTQANIHKVAEIIKAIDAGAEDVTVVRVFRLNYADPTELSELLVNLFPDDSKSGGSSTPMQFGGGGGFGGLRSFFRGGGGPGGGGPGGGASSSGSNTQRIKKRARVVAVPDPRTSSVAVTAARDLMDQVEQVITELDSNPAKVKQVKVIHIENADMQQVMQVLQDTFSSTGTGGRSTANQNSALTTRANQQNGTSSTTSSTRIGSSSRGGGGMGGSFGQ